MSKIRTDKHTKLQNVHVASKVIVIFTCLLPIVDMQLLAAARSGGWL